MKKILYITFSYYFLIALCLFQVHEFLMYAFLLHVIYNMVTNYLVEQEQRKGIEEMIKKFKKNKEE